MSATITLQLLKAEHEAGGGTTKIRKRKIKEQLARECALRGCHQTLAFMRSNAVYCSKPHLKAALFKKAHKRPTAKQNREKKERYYANHGIVFNSNIRRAVTPAKQTDYLSPSSATLIYENYKEPLQPIPKAVGYGYYGTLAQTEDHMYVQCHICGNLFQNVAMHLRLHRIKADAYKDKFQLNKTTVLIADEERERQQREVVRNLRTTLPAHLVEYNRKVQSGEIKHNPNPRGDRTMSLEERNRRGLCPAQVLEKIMELAEKLGHTPGYEEFQREYHGKYVSSIRYHYGSWTNAVHKCKMTTLGELRHPSKAKLILDLRDFYDKHLRIPMTSDFNRGLLRDRGVYIREFGSLNNARVEAGLNAVIPMPFGQIIELTPEQYAEYRAGHAVKAIKGGNSPRPRRLAEEVA